MSIRKAARAQTKQTIEAWAQANGGQFPADVVLAARFGDERFYITGHLRDNTPAVNYPLWDYSRSAIRLFRELAGNIAYPRTWGFPEVYGAGAYAWWMYGLHKSCADLAGSARDAAHKIAPDLLVFRNTTRDGIFTLQNDHDGSGPELLTQNLDMVHLDPYPVLTKGYGNHIPRDMTYYAGLARRYAKPLVLWLQAHAYEPMHLVHPEPHHIDRMANEHWDQGVDAVIGKRPG